MAKERNSSIELLRIFAGMAVIVLHFNFNPAGGGAVECTAGITKEFLLFLEAVCACAVNVFILISGYFNINSKSINLSRIIQILLQTITFSFAFKIVSCVINNSWNIKGIIMSLIPVNYYVILYIALMLISPYLNLIVNSLTTKETSTLLIVSFALFSIYTTGVDVLEDVIGHDMNGLNAVSLLGSGAGYTIINFILIYLIGASIKKLDFVSSISLTKTVAVFLLSVEIIFIWRKVLPDTAWMYCNPIVIIEAVSLFLMFAKMKTSNKFVNLMAPASFTCYLIHEQILNLLGDRFFGNGSLLKIMFVLLITVAGIYMISFVVMSIWNFITKPIYKKTIDKLKKIEVIK